jgi:hypothetical protein
VNLDPDSSPEGRPKEAAGPLALLLSWLVFL